MATVTTFDVFLSHNSRDKDTVERIAERLHRAGVTPWLDKWALVPGGAWQNELGAGLEASSACAVFIGPHDLGDWELQEVALAIDRAAKEHGFRVFPVLLPGVREPFDPNRLPHFLRARTWVDFRRGHEDRRALQDLIHAIKGIPFGPETAVRRGDDVCPYRGLEVFDLEHAEFYFGRDGEIQRLLEQLKVDRFLAVLGPSGSGKSSLVRAGLLAALQRGALDGRWRSLVMRPGAAPLTALAAALTPSGAMQATLDGLRADPRTLQLALAQMVGADAPEDRIVLVVDQLEEVFTLCSDEEERNALFSNLIHATSAAGGPGVVVVTIRADFYQRLAPYRELSQLVSGRQMLVSPMGRDALRQAIEEPVRRVGLEFEEGLIDTILEDAGAEPGSLPLLQYALLELWERRRGTMLTLEGYRDAGGVQGALAKRADEVVASFSAADQELARRTLLRLTQPGEGTEDTRRRAPLSELAGMEPVLDRLVNARLLTTSSDADQQLVDVSHEALIRAWPRLREWIDADRAGLRLLRQLTDAARDWERLGRDDSALYRGARLAAAREFDPDQLNPLEREFVGASVALTDREQREREEQARRELEAVRRGRRRLLVAAAALLAGAVGAGVAAVIALEQKNTAQRERNIALSRQFAAASTQQLPADPERGLVLAREAAHSARTAQAEDALRAALQSPIRAALRTGSAQGIAVAGDRVAQLGDGGKLHVWDARSGRQIGVLTGPGAISEFEFSPDGTRLAIVGDDGLRITRAPGRAVRPGGVPNLFDATGERVLWQPSAGTLTLSDGHSGRTLRHLMSVEAPDVRFDVDAAFVSGGRQVVTASPNGTQLWDARTGRLARTWSKKAASIASADAAGNRVAVADGPTGVIPVSLGPNGFRVWDVRRGHTVMQGTTSGGALELSPDGRRVDDKGELWDVDRARRVALPGFDSVEYLISAFSSEGNWLATSTVGGIVVWDAHTGERVTEMKAGTTQPTALAFAGGGRLYSVQDDAVLEWDVGARRLQGSGGMYGAAAVSGDGRLAAGISGTRRPVVWDLRSGRLRLGRPAGEVPNSWGSAPGFTAAGQVVYDVNLGVTSPRFNVVDVGSGQTLRTIAGVDAIDAEATQRLVIPEGKPQLRFTDVRGQTTVSKAPANAQEPALSPDGRRVAFTDGANVEVWDTSPLRRRARLDAIVMAPDMLRFSRDGARLLAGDIEGRVHLWNVATRRRIVLPGHKGYIASAQFSDDGRYVVTSGHVDRIARVWNATSGRLLAELPSSGAAALLPDNSGIVTLGGGPPLIRACDGCGTWDQLVRRIETRARRPLTPAERATYVQ